MPWPQPAAAARALQWAQPQQLLSGDACVGMVSIVSEMGLYPLCEVEKVTLGSSASQLPLSP